MKKTLLPFLFILSIGFTCLAQNEPVPKYLTTQDFPDSVKTLSIVTLQGQPTSFGSVLEKHKGKTIIVDIWAHGVRIVLWGTRN